MVSSRYDIGVTDSSTGRTWPLKLAIREFSKSDREGKNFQLRDATLRAVPDGIIVLLYLNDATLRERGDPVKAAWVLVHGLVANWGKGRCVTAGREITQLGYYVLLRAVIGARCLCDHPPGFTSFRR